MNIIFRILLSCVALSISAEVISASGSRHLLYVASPGIRNYIEYGGIGVLVFDVDDGYKFVRRIPTWTVPEGKKVENVKGIAASAKTGIVYVTSLDSMIAITLSLVRRYGARPILADAIGWPFRQTETFFMFRNSRGQHGT